MSNTFLPRVLGDDEYREILDITRGLWYEVQNVLRDIEMSKTYDERGTEEDPPVVLLELWARMSRSSGIWYSITVLEVVLMEEDRKLRQMEARGLTRGQQYSDGMACVRILRETISKLENSLQ